jgi:hypothetical protein
MTIRAFFVPCPKCEHKETVGKTLSIATDSPFEQGRDYTFRFLPSCNKCGHEKNINDFGLQE